MRFGSLTVQISRDSLVFTLDRFAWTGQPGQAAGTAGTSQSGQVHWDQSVWTGQYPGQFSLDRSIGTGQPGEISRERSAWAGQQSERLSLTGQPGQDRWDKSARTGMLLG
jgi:hypothetical protein